MTLSRQSEFVPIGEIVAQRVLPRLARRPYRTPLMARCGCWRETVCCDRPIMGKAGVSGRELLERIEFASA